MVLIQSMTILTLREGPGAKSLIKCDNCGEEEERLTCTCKKSKFHYCDSECKIEHQTNKKRGAYIKPIKDIQYRADKGNERRDAKLKKQDKVKKRCTKCKKEYEGPPGGFPKDRDPNEPEPGRCPVCSKLTVYEQDYGGMVNG